MDNIIEVIDNYVERTHLPPRVPGDYRIPIKEILALANMPDRSLSIMKAFAYGMAKGYRAAKAEKGATR